MQIDKEPTCRVTALIAVCLLVQAPSIAAGVDGADAAARAAAPRAGTIPQFISKSPYAAWRARREQVEKPDTSGHGHRAPRPQGQSRSRRLPQ
jgi:hypothetical protein